MTVLTTGRWPSIYSLEDLRRAVREIVDAGAEFETKFYQHGKYDGVCQGDVIGLRAPLPMLDQEGQAVTFEGEDYEHWLVVSNTCDHERSETIEVAPLILLPNVVQTELETLRRYEYAKKFYVPPWPGGADRAHRIADFPRMAVLEKAALNYGAAEVVARMGFPGWAVLHTCLIMYFARDDGRFD